MSAVNVFAVSAANVTGTAIGNTASALKGNIAKDKETAPKASSLCGTGDLFAGVFCEAKRLTGMFELMGKLSLDRLRRRRGQFEFGEDVAVGGRDCVNARMRRRLQDRLFLRCQFFHQVSHTKHVGGILQF